MEKNKLMMIVIIVLLVVLLGTIVGVAFYVLNNMNKDQTDVTPPPTVEVDLSTLKTLSVGEFKRNLKRDTDDMQFIQCSVSFEINSAEDKDDDMFNLMTSKVDMIRDVILSVLGNWSLSEIEGENGEERLKEEILTKVSEVMQTNLIWSVNISDILYMTM